MKLKTLWILLLALLMSVSAAAESIEEYDDEGNITYSGANLPDIRVVNFIDGYDTENGTGEYLRGYVTDRNVAENYYSIYGYDEEGTILTFEREYTGRETIKAAQEALNAAGYDCGAPDGVLGSGTAAVITQI